MPARVAPELWSALSVAVREERAAAKALADARATFKAALHRTTDAAVALRDAGAPLTAAAVVVARELGRTPSVEERKRIASRLRRRLARERTVSHAGFAHPSPPLAAAPLPSIATTMEEAMPRLVKRTVEEYIEEAPKKARAIEPRDEELEEVLDELGGADDDEDEEAERPRRRRK